MFDFEGETYRSALIPSNRNRLERQLEAVSPYCDEVLAYQYLGLMNQPGTIAFCGHPDSLAFYQDYKALRDRIALKEGRSPAPCEGRLEKTFLEGN